MFQIYTVIREVSTLQRINICAPYSNVSEYTASLISLRLTADTTSPPVVVPWYANRNVLYHNSTSSS